MNDRVFLDTNILVYAYSVTEPQKQAIARQLIVDRFSFISTQVLQELTNTVTKKFKFSYQAASTAVEECCMNSNLTINDKDTILTVHKIADKYGFSFYDSLIISAGLSYILRPLSPLTGNLNRTMGILRLLP